MVSFGSCRQSRFVIDHSNRLPLVLHFPSILLSSDILCVCLHWSVPSWWSFCFNAFAPFISFPLGFGQSCPQAASMTLSIFFSLMRQWVSELHVMINYLPMQSKPIGVDCLSSHMTTVFNFASFSLSAILSLVLPVTAAVPSGGAWMGNCSRDWALGRLTRHVLAPPNVSQLVQTAARFALSSPFDSLNAH